MTCVMPLSIPRQATPGQVLLLPSRGVRRPPTGRVVSPVRTMGTAWPVGSRRGCALGAVLVASVVAWKLARSSYRADVDAICQGESLAGFPVRRDMAGVSERIRARLATPEGNVLFSRLRDAPLGARAERLRAAATATGLRRCPMADTFDQLAAEAEYRSEVQQLCSYVTFPGLQDMGDPARVRTLGAWIGQSARTERMGELAAILRPMETSADAAKALRDAAAEIDVFTCDTAKVLDTPPVVSCTPAPGPEASPAAWSPSDRGSRPVSPLDARVGGNAR